MSFQIVMEPIDRWPLPDTKPRKPAAFRVGYTDTVELLARELELVGARGAVVMQVVTRNGAADLRRDGLLRSQAKIEHPGVRLSFESKHGPLTYATDVFEYRYAGQPPDWQANLRAIALGLEALRTVDRYGISKSGEQYRGWRAIEAAASEGPLEVLARWAGRPAEAFADTAQLIRAARIGAHPDRHGGDHGPSDQVLEAMRDLGVEI